MPNHVTNRISFRGDPEAIRRMLEAVKNDEEGYGSIDFNKIIPMPPELNIESGSRTTEGIKLYNAFLDIYKLGKGQNVDLFSIPEESEKAFLKMRTDIDKKTWKLGRAACRNIQQFGCPTWYEWCNRNWDTKWNAYDFNSEGNDISFHTAWSAPLPVLRELSRLYPEIEITHEWADEDIGHNCGHYVFSGGKMTEGWMPADGRDSYEFAASVLGEDLADFGLVLNADETDYIYAGGEQYDVLELLGQRVLRSDWQLTLSEIPLGMYLYHLGTSDDRSRYNCICDHCPENFGCSIVTLQPIELGPDGERPLAEDELPRFTTDKFSFEDLLQETITEDEPQTEEMGGMEL